MSGLLLLVIGGVALLLGYIFYGEYLKKKIAEVDPSIPTPAHKLYDGVDYVPANKYVLFGHHFASIAGAGPIVGPMIASASYGWLGVFLWIIVGGIFMGALHDFLTLIVSVRNDGKSISEISKMVISDSAKIAFQVFVYLALVIVVAMFAKITALTFVSDPQIILPTLMLILIAILFGWMVYSLKISIPVASLISLSLIALFLYLGYLFPIDISPIIKAIVPNTDVRTIVLWTWIAVLMIYAFIASITPVWIILQPRDFLSFFLLLIGIILGTLGIIATNPKLNAPIFVQPKGEDPFWPVLFITVACGAISGFHSLVASGTTAKQLNSEKDAKFVTYGAMLTESFLALIALIAVTGGLDWKSLIEFVKSGGTVAGFAQGFGNITKGLGLGTDVGKFYGMLMLNAFVLTTLDTATRLARFIAQELGGHIYKPLEKRHITMSAITIVLALIFMASGAVEVVWKLFGTSNQLVSALVLVTLSLYYLSQRKPILPIVIPAIFMVLTTIASLIITIYKFLVVKLNITFAITGIVLLVFAVWMLIESTKTFVKLLKQQR